MRSPVLSTRQFEWTLATFVASLAAHALWLPGWFALLAASLLLARWLQRRRYARAWPVWVKFPLLLAVLALVVFEFGNPLARQAGTALLVGLTTLKLIESERRRDGLLVVTVCFFLISVQFLFNQGLGVTLYMLLPSLIGFLALNELQAPPGTRGGLLDRFSTASRELLLLLAVALPLTAFLFLTLPRLSEPLWGTRDNRWQAKTGLSETMSPGSITELLGDDSPVMRVEFSGAIPRRNQMYWRGPVLWRFDGVEWTMNLLYQTQLHGNLDGPQQGAADDLRYQVMMEPSERRWLFLLDRPTGFPADARRTMDGQVVRNKPVMQLYHYEAASDLGAPVPLDTLPLEQKRMGLQLPEGMNPRSAELAASWRQQYDDDRMALARRALQYFREQPFGYSLSPPPLLSRHRIDEFLFETRRGFCEHYAAAFVVLMRQAGVPARVVTGYQGAEYNRAGDYFVVRNSDAHAWAEILVDGLGWVRMEPTGAVAPERIELGAEATLIGGGSVLFRDGGLLRDWRDRLDAVQAWWNRVVVRFDTARQRALLADFGIDSQDWRQMALWVGLGIATVGLLGALLFLRQLRPPPSDEAQRLYRRFLRQLAHRQLRRQPAEGPLDFSRRAADAWPERGPAILHIGELYARARYAGDAQAQAGLAAAIKAFGKR